MLDHSGGATNVLLFATLQYIKREPICHKKFHTIVLLLSDDLSTLLLPHGVRYLNHKKEHCGACVIVRIYSFGIS